MKCPNCKKDNKKGARFCRFCGEPLAGAERILTLSFMLKALLVIYAGIFLFYCTYLFIEPKFQKFVNSIATKF
ncbi:MAG: zinc ribbon domain-containing protein [Elusimicrobia bacterium]|nr:zinc ribbon domain-containing protein [Elusimicrobiota bacterium]